MNATSTAMPRPSRLLLQGLIVALAALALGAWLQVNPGYVTRGEQSEWMWQRSQGLPPGDGYFHIRMAYLYRTGEVQAAGPDFHWTRESLWNGGYSDKDYLYHIALIPFTAIARDSGDFDGLILAAKVSACFGGALVALAFWGALILLRVPRPWLWLAALAAVGGRMLLVRASEPRSWVFGVAFCLLGYALMARRKRAWLMAVAVAYVLSYTGSHLLIAMAAFRLMAAAALPPQGESRLFALKQEALTLGVVLLGFTAGWLLHPNPMELARIWWVQNILVPQTAQLGYLPEFLRPLSAAVLGWAPGTPQPSMTLALFGGEMRAPGLQKVVTDFYYLFAIPVALAVASLVARAKPSREALLATVIAAGFGVLVLRHERFAEYAAPWWMLAAALWVSGLAGAGQWQRLAGKVPPVLASVLLPCALIVAVAVQTARAGNALGYFQPGVFREGGDWMARQPELKGAVIYNHSWDAFSELFFYRADADYMAGLDPMFTASRGTKNSRDWLLLMQNRVPEVAPDGPTLVRVLRDDFGAQYLFVHRLTSQRFFETTLRMAAAGQLEVAFDARDRGYMLYRLPAR